MAEHVSTFCAVLLGLYCGVGAAQPQGQVTQAASSVAGGAQESSAAPLQAGVVRYDPTRPPTFVPEVPTHDAEPPLILQAVLATAQHQVATISGHRMTIGQTLRSYRLIALNNHQATLEGPQGHLVLWLAPALHGASTSMSSKKPDDIKKETVGAVEKTAPSLGERK